MSVMEYKEAESVKKLAASLDKMLKDESRWRIVGEVRCPSDLPFMFLQPEAHAWKFYMRSDQDNVDIDYHNRCSSEPRLRFRGKNMDNASALGESIKKVFRERAHFLYDKLYWKHRRKWEEREASEALHPALHAPVVNGPYHSIGEVESLDMILHPEC